MKLFRLLLIILLPALGACSGGHVNFDDTLTDATTAYADGDYRQAQHLAEMLLPVVMGPDSAAVTETQAGQLGILFMKLSEHGNEDENIADATVCLRRAFYASNDSLREFFVSLPVEDTPHFVLLRRLALSIDNPVDLTDEDIARDEPLDSIAE